MADKFILSFVCAWTGCDEAFQNEKDMPPGWSDMFLFRSNGPMQLTQQSASGKDVLRDCCLCPQHTSELQYMLKTTQRDFRTETT